MATAILLNDASPVAEAKRRTSDPVGANTAAFPFEWERSTTDRRAPTTAGWSYEEAFSRNLGLISREEQTRLRNARVAVAGLGGVGGVDLVTLARLGIGKFTIADPDVFEVANFNRQYGATCRSLGEAKVQTMARAVREINPAAEIRELHEPIGSDNVSSFLADADLFVDGLELFEIDVRRQLFRTAASRGIPAVTAGPMGFSTCWLVFDPNGMSFDRYFDLHDGMDYGEKLIAFLCGLAPSATHRRYLDVAYVDVVRRTAPSTSLACQLAAGVMAGEALKLLLGRGPVQAAPVYHQFDAYFSRLVTRRLNWGNRNPFQKLKRLAMRRMAKRLGIYPTSSQCVSNTGEEMHHGDR